MAKDKKNQEETKEEEQVVGEGQTVVDEQLLQEVLNKNEAMSQKLSKQSEEIDKLTKVANRGRIQKYEQENRGELVKRVSLPFFEDDEGTYFINAWEMVKDKVTKTRQGELVADQVIRLHLKDQDGLNSDDEYDDVESSPAEVDYGIFAQNSFGEEGEVIERSTEQKKGEGETTMLTVRLDDGRTFRIDKTYVNQF